jgi:hypothetical protein
MSSVTDRVLADATTVRCPVAWTVDGAPGESVGELCQVKRGGDGQPISRMESTYSRWSADRLLRGLGAYVCATVPAYLEFFRNVHFRLPVRLRSRHNIVYVAMHLYWLHRYHYCQASLLKTHVVADMSIRQGGNITTVRPRGLLNQGVWRCGQRSRLGRSPRVIPGVSNRDIPLILVVSAIGPI